MDNENLKSFKQIRKEANDNGYGMIGDTFDKEFKFTSKLAESIRFPNYDKILNPLRESIGEDVLKLAGEFNHFEQSYSEQENKKAKEKFKFLGIDDEKLKEVKPIDKTTDNPTDVLNKLSIVHIQLQIDAIKNMPSQRIEDKKTARWNIFYGFIGGLLASLLTVWLTSSLKQPQPKIEIQPIVLPKIQVAHDTIVIIKTVTVSITPKSGSPVETPKAKAIK